MVNLDHGSLRGLIMKADHNVPRMTAHSLLGLLLGLLALSMSTCAITGAAGAAGVGVWTKTTPNYDAYYLAGC